MRAKAARKLREVAEIARQEAEKELRLAVGGRLPRRLVFDHLPKCGGSSIMVYLRSNYLRRQTFAIDGARPLADVARFRRLPEARRHGFQLVSGHLANRLVPLVHGESLLVTVLRDPIDRIVSHYYFAKGLREHYLHDTIVRRGLSLEEYVTSGISDELTNWYTAHFSQRTPAEVEAAPEESLQAALDAVRRYDLVGFVDDIGGFATALRALAELPIEFGGTRTNVTRTRPKLRDVPEASLATIAAANHLDVQLYREVRAARGAG
jgi:hypothetical protein